MTEACALPTASPTIAAQLAAYADCHARLLGHSGFDGVLGHLLLPTLLTSLLTIYVALIGYRLLLGQAFDLRNAVLAALRLGIVIALATSWPTFETLIYRVSIEGPAEIAAVAVTGSDIEPSSAEDAAGRLQRVYDVANAAARENQPVSAPTPGLVTTGIPPQSRQTAETLKPLNLSGILLFGASVGPLVAVRLAAGVLLAFGPLFIALALFDTTLGFAVGWLRALAALMLAGAGVSIVVGLELRFLEAALAAAGADPAAMASLASRGLMLGALLFGATTLAVLWASAFVAGRFNIKLERLTALAAAPLRHAPEVARATSSVVVSRTEDLEPPSRARAIAGAVSAIGQREREALPHVFGETASNSGSFRIQAVTEPFLFASSSEGVGPNRSTIARRSGSAKRRDVR